MRMNLGYRLIVSLSYSSGPVGRIGKSAWQWSLGIRDCSSGYATAAATSVTRTSTSSDDAGKPT